MTWPPLALLGVVLVSVAGLNDHQTWTQTEWPPNLRTIHWVTTNLVRRPPTWMTTKLELVLLQGHHFHALCLPDFTCRQCEIWSNDGKQYAAQVSLGWMVFGLPESQRQTETGWRTQSTTRSNCNWGRLAHQCLTQLPCAPAWTWGCEAVHEYVNKLGRMNSERHTK